MCFCVYKCRHFLIHVQFLCNSNPFETNLLCIFSSQKMKYRPTYFPAEHIQRGRKPQDENKVPFQLARNSRLTLRDGILNTGARETMSPCIPEITLVFACLKKNNFEEHFCAKEITAFQECSAHSRKLLQEEKVKRAMGTYIPGEKLLDGKKLNIFLKKFPNL